MKNFNEGVGGITDSQPIKDDIVNGDVGIGCSSAETWGGTHNPYKRAFSEGWDGGRRTNEGWGGNIGDGGTTFLEGWGGLKKIALALAAFAMTATPALAQHRGHYNGPGYNRSHGPSYNHRPAPRYNQYNHRNYNHYNNRNDGAAIAAIIGFGALAAIASQNNRNNTYCVNEVLRDQYGYPVYDYYGREQIVENCYRR